MFERKLLDSNFISKNLKDKTHFHFLGPDNDSSMFLKVNNLDNFDKSKLYYWYELFQTKNAPIVVINIILENNLKIREKYQFLFNIKDSSDNEELTDIINQGEIILNFVEFQSEQLYFGFSYILSFDNQVIEELKRIILQAKDNTRKLGNDYDYSKALKVFLEKKEAILQMKSKQLSECEIFLPQYEEDLTNQQTENQQEINKEVFKPETTITENPEQEQLVVKTYKRDLYEMMKTNQNIPIEQKLKIYEDKVVSLETNLKSKNKEIDVLKSEIKYLKEELSYLKLDKSKKGWWIFKKDTE